MKSPNSSPRSSQISCGNVGPKAFFLAPGRSAESKNPNTDVRGQVAAGDYLAQLAEEMGDPAEPVNPRALPPETRWVSLENGLRTDGELEDRAADIPGDVLKGNVIRLNENFRGFRDLFDYFVREVNAEGDDHLVVRVHEVVKEWVETQALEIVTAVRALEGTSFWMPEDLEAALSPEALTTGLMGRYFVIERVRRVLGSEFGKHRPKAEAYT